MTTQTQKAVDPKKKMYAITVERDGEVFTREVSILGIPLWIPQKEDRGLPLELVGEVVDMATLPPNEEAGFGERDAIILRTKTTHWAVPVGVVLQRQFAEMRAPKVGDRILVTFDGKARKASKKGFAPANLFSISFLDSAKTDAAQKRLAAEAKAAVAAQS